MVQGDSCIVPLGMALLVADDLDGDAIEPAGERSLFRIKVPQVPPGAQEGFLGRVFSRLLVPEQAIGPAVDT